ncbi:MAG: alpha-amylase/4-alpha-glucanotransferase domain-containing protein, partial [Chloroflexota bacterium]
MNARKVYLGLAIHNHQPVGNFPSVFARAYQQAYLPMLEALERHPSVRLSLHYSGPLLDWLKENQPGFLQRVASLAQRDQIEVMGSAYYEPILPAIPDADKLGQIMMMGDFCEQTFGRRPAGFWLAERVWEPGLPLVLSQAAVEWTVVDDTHFKSAGLTDEDLLGYYMTEEQGHTLKVFPSSKFLRYAVPFNTVEQVMEYLHSRASDECIRIVAMGDDGEKFGVWPKTYEHCWGRGQWMERFFSAIEENRSWLEAVPLGIFARHFPPLGPIYLPCASYDEMLEWALPSDRSLQLSEARHRLEAEGREDIAGFMRGGYWRHFMVKYPEVNWMHKRMLRAHRKVHQACALDRSGPGLRELWQAQCNCPYWHGVFGGLYLADIRATTYQHLVEAEQQADRVLRPGRPYLVYENTDLDMDGHEELFVDGAAFSLCLSPHRGGTLVEWDLHRPSFNLLSTLARRPEAYHKGLASLATGQQDTGTRTIHAELRLKDPNVARLLSYDRYPRFSLIDHFLSPDIGL